jgi:hypothetical protein
MKQIFGDALYFGIIKDQKSELLYDYRCPLILTQLATLINKRHVDAYYPKRTEIKLQLFQACLTSVVLIME